MSKSHGNILYEIFPDMIFIQETMFACEPTLFHFARLKPRWEFSATDVVGLFIVLLTSWNPSIVHFKDYSFLFGLMVKDRFRGLDSILYFLNYCGLYNDRECFWNFAMGGGILTILI